MTLVLSVVSVIMALCIALGWVGLHINQTRWAQGYRLDEHQKLPLENPGVSVVIPVRDEIDNIQECLTALVASKHVDLQVIVVDDFSTDGTPALVREVITVNPNISLVSLEDIGGTWFGKSRACWEGAKHATEPVLLFIDADVRLHPNAIVMSLLYASKHRIGLLSLFGTWELVTVWERLLIPVVGWFIRGTAGVADVNNGARAFANGQFMMFSKAEYLRIGGHEQVRGAVLDDVGLAHVCHKSDVNLGLLWAPWAYRVRLYRSLREILDGYSKNLFAGMDRNYFLGFLSVLFLLAFSLVPLCLTVVFWVNGSPMIAACWGASVLLMVLFRYRLEHIDRRSGRVWVALMHPLGVGIFCSIIINSMVRQTVYWKGRGYERGTNHE